MSPERQAPGIRTRLLLQISVTLIITATMVLSLMVVRVRMRDNVQSTLHIDLQQSLMTFQDLQARRRSALERENNLLATLPTLRALMTTHDPRTVRDSASDFWKLGGNDLFALADEDGHVIAAYAKGAPDQDELVQRLQPTVANPTKHYITAGGNLYEVSVMRIYFGTAETGTLLGYVISGYAVDRALLREVGRGASAESAFLSGDRVMVTTLPEKEAKALGAQQFAPGSAVAIRLEKERFLAASADLSTSADIPLRLVVLKSFISADRAERAISKAVGLAGLLAIAVGCALMLLLARNVTAPLERLSDAVKAFATGNQDYTLPHGGPQEVRYLSAVIADMREEIQKQNRALLESERLATIGRMANSVSHDLRHYLAAIYANSEFLASPTMSAEERVELFEEIRLAVNGTTDMLDALLLFGSTGSAARRVATQMSTVVERAVSLVRAHPDAERVHVSVSFPDEDTTAEVDPRQVERAIYNLLLNACQSVVEAGDEREVSVLLKVDSEFISVNVKDSGPGVPENIRHSLFDPFVSEGKQKGTGLGLTLASSVAHEHNGGVELLSSRPGETIFRLSVQRKSTLQVRSAGSTDLVAQ